jgi:hypothetical protein
MPRWKTVTNLPRDVREIENAWIPMPDGARLAARLWLPAGAEREPVPAVLEYLPYRKRAGTRGRDEPMHRYFAGHGLASVRVDLRGSGESDGVLLDEYLEQEQEDGLAVLRWIAGQPWCTGRVGMIGKSWGGFNALQVAARRPPELGGVIAVCAADDRYADDAHYMGGCLLNENLVWGTVLLAVAAQPPDPALVGERWRELWRARLEALPLYPALWLAHQRRDAYWRQGSVCEDFGAIRCPVYAVGGWADGYTNAIPRLLAGLTGPRKGLIGPWAHVYPHNGTPGPAIGFLQEALAFFEQCLSQRERGLFDEPMLRAWMPERAGTPAQEGRWIAESEWPSPRIAPRAFALLPGGLSDAEAGEPDATELVHRSPQTTGQHSGAWCAFGLAGDAPGEQRADDARSLVFDSAPLEDGFEILGAPEVELSLAVDRPQAFVAARLCDVAPDGRSTRVTYGLLNLTHAGGHAEPAPLEPGRRYSVRIRLNDVAHAFGPGHRLRLALSTAYWPIAWPSPAAVTLRVFCGASRLVVPVRPPHEAGAEGAALRAFEPPEAAAADPRTDLDHAPPRRTVHVDPASGETIVTASVDDRADGEPALERYEAIDLELGHAVRETFRIHPDDPRSARTDLAHKTEMRRGAWRARVEIETGMTADATSFRLRARLRAWEGDERIAARAWDVTIPRDGV